MPLEAHPQHIGRFVAALFRYADEGSFVSLRGFDQFDRGKPPMMIEGVAIDGDLKQVVDRAVSGASKAANAVSPVVFAPPVATFKDPRRARTEDLVNGVAISVEIDAGDPAVARGILEQLLGPATIALTSGSEWVDDRTGEIHRKMHLHWRLSEPTRSAQEHTELQTARWLAAVLVGADTTAAPPVHPLRWPGSWNCKARPAMAEIVHEAPDAEVHLGAALEALQEAVEASGLGKDRNSGPKASGAPQTAVDRLTRAVLAIPNLDLHWEDWNRIGMAMFRGSGGAPESLAAWAEWSAKSNKHSEDACTNRWRHYGVSPPTRLGAGTIIHLAKQAGWQEYRMFEEQNAPDEPPRQDPEDPGYQPDENHQPRSRRRADGEIAWPIPVDFMSEDMMGAPALEERHLPGALWGFARDVADRMGVDPAGVALSALVCCSSVISEKWRLQPRRHDWSYTEGARLWGAILGPPSTIKTAQISECSRPIDKLEIEARKKHTDAMRIYETALAEHKRALKAKEETVEPKLPKLERFLAEDVTIEALSEVLRDKEDAKGRQYAPAGKVLVRQDELSELFANMDRYKGGGGASDRGAYLRLFNGTRYVMDRVQRGAFAINSWSGCIIGGCQPGPIQKVARDTVDDGLLQRFLFCMAATQRIGIDREPNQRAISRYQAVFPVLANLHPAREVGSDRVSPIVLHRDAHAIREDVEAVARAMGAMPDTSKRMQSAFGKWPGIFMRLVLTFHMIEIADAKAQDVQTVYPNVVPLETVERAASYMLEIILPHQMRADAMMFSTARTGHAQWIAGFILAKGHKRVTRTDVTRAYGHLRAPEAAQELAAVMSNLVTVGWLEPEEVLNPAKGTHAWLVNPHIHTLFAERAAREKSARAEAQEMAKRDLATLLKKRRAKESTSDLPRNVANVATPLVGIVSLEAAYTRASAPDTSSDICDIHPGFRPKTGHQAFARPAMSQMSLRVRGI